MTGDELEATWREYKRTGAVELRNALVVEYLPVVRGMARRMHRKLPRAIDVLDLEQAGVFGLLDAIEDFDPGRGTCFENFCPVQLHHAMIDWLRAVDRRVAFYDDVTWLADRAHVRHVDPAEGFMRAEIPGFVRKRLGQLPARDRDLLRRYYVEDRSMKDIGAAWGVSESHVCKLHSTALGSIVARDPSLRARRSSKRSGLPVGVFQVRTKFVALASLGGRQRNLGTYHTAREASIAYQRAVGMA